MLSNHKLTCVSPPCFFAFVFSLNPVRWSPLFSKSAALGLILAKHFCLKAIPILMADRIVENWGYRVVTSRLKELQQIERQKSYLRHHKPSELDKYKDLILYLHKEGLSATSILKELRRRVRRFPIKSTSTITRRISKWLGSQK